MQAILSERISNYLPVRETHDPIAASGLAASLARVGLGMPLAGAADGQSQGRAAARRAGLVFHWG
jgi:hypothetical protein